MSQKTRGRGERAKRTVPLPPSFPHAKCESLSEDRLARALASYEVYVSSLFTRRHHGDRAFPVGEARALVSCLMAGGRLKTHGPQTVLWGDGLGESALRLGALAVCAARAAQGEGKQQDGAGAPTGGGASGEGGGRGTGKEGERPEGGILRLEAAGSGGRTVDLAILAWAAVLLPFGPALGARLVEALGGQDLWVTAPPCHLGAVFSGRLQGVPPRSREVLLTAAEREDGSGPLGLRGSEIPEEAYALAAAVRGAGDVCPFLERAPKDGASSGQGGLWPLERAWQRRVDEALRREGRSRGASEGGTPG